MATPSAEQRQKAQAFLLAAVSVARETYHKYLI
jgi:hypothetical protein